MFESLGIIRSYKLPFLKTYWRENEVSAIFNCLVRNKMVVGPETKKFEDRIGDRFKTKFAFATNSGRSAIQVILESMLSEKDKREVLVPSFGCTGIIQPIIQAGLTPVFVDISEDLNISPDSVEDKITKNTKAIIVPSLCGKPANWIRFKKIANKKDLFLIDDASQSVGAKYRGKFLGTLGDAGVFSFTLGKIISSTGGGMVLTDSRYLYDEILNRKINNERYLPVLQRTFRTLMLGPYRRYGLPLFSISNLKNKIFSRTDLSFEVAKMSNIDASIGLEQMKSIDKIIQLRRRNAKILDEGLSCITEIELPEYTKDHIFTKYIIQFNKLSKHSGALYPRELNEFSSFLAKKGIETEWTYTPLHLRKQYSRFYDSSLPTTEKIWYKCITLPVNPNFNEEQMEYIVSTVKKHFISNA